MSELILEASEFFASRRSIRVQPQDNPPSMTSAGSIPISPAALLSFTSHTLPNRLLITELFFSVPLDHSQPDGRQVKIFCRSAERPPPALASMDDKDNDQLPYLVYVPGGPGFGCPSPQDMLAVTNFVLDKGYKLLCFDHRGMGMSAPITARSLEKEGETEEKADYLKMFRATEAVKDLEAIRLCLTKEYDDGEKQKWSVMGQSYGGYLCTTYLSFSPNGLREAWLLGGLPPVLERKPDVAIRWLVRKVRERNEAYYQKYEEDVERVKDIVEYLKSKQKDGEAVTLPSGGTLSAGRFLEMGLHFGFHGGLDAVHNVVLRVFRDLGEDGEISRPALATLESMGWFDDAVLYGVLHAALYCQGEAARWAFDRVVGEEEGFGVEGEKERFLFTGEMVFRRTFDDCAELRGLKQVTDKLMEFDAWPDLYDVEQLEKNEVPVYAAVFVHDMYVGFESATTTAGLIKGCKAVVTNQMYHDAVRGKTEEVLKALFALRDEPID